MASEPTVRRFTVDEYYRMAEAGILAEDDRVELLDGEILQMTPIGSRHAACVDRVLYRFRMLPAERAIIRVQSPIRPSDRSAPQPDVTLLKHRADFYDEEHPGPEDVLLILEVAETSVKYDRDRKLPLYARAGVREIWLLDLRARQIHACLEPRGGSYRPVRLYGAGEELAPAAFPELRVGVSEFLLP